MMESSEIQRVLLTDLGVVLGCGLLLVWKGKLGLMHPAVAYLFFHLYAFTYRLYAISQGLPMMYAHVPHFEPVNWVEVTRAMCWADVGLVSFTLGALWAAQRETRHRFRQSMAPAPVQLVSPDIIKTVVAICLPIGLVCFVIFRTSGFQSTSLLGQTSYGFLLAHWPITCLALLIYLYGFRWYLVCALVPWYIITGLQGFDRFMVIQPTLLLAYIHMKRARRNWPPPATALVLLGLFAIFPVLKEMGHAFKRSGQAGVQSVAMEGATSMVGRFAERAPDLLDQYAATLTLVDRNGRYYYGRPALALLVYPVPRVLWPDKPVINQASLDIATRGRPIAHEGRVMTILGDAYANFGVAGSLVLPALLGFALSYWYRSTVGYPWFCLRSLVYLVFASTWLQTYRDTVTSIVFFGLFHMMPFMFVLIWHWGRRRSRAELEAWPGLRGQEV